MKMVMSRQGMINPRYIVRQWTAKQGDKYVELAELHDGSRVELYDEKTDHGELIANMNHDLKAVVGWGWENDEGELQSTVSVYDIIAWRIDGEYVDAVIVEELGDSRYAVYNQATTQWLIQGDVEGSGMESCIQAISDKAKEQYRVRKEMQRRREEKRELRGAR